MKKIKRNCLPYNKAYICGKCNYMLLSSSIITCVYCNKRKKRQQAVIYHRDKYPTFIEHNQREDNRIFICRECDGKLLGNVDCVSCKRSTKRTSALLFKRDKYDCSKSPIKELLVHTVQNCTEQKYICKTCHSNLHKKRNKTPTIPRILQSKHKQTAAE